MHPLSRAARLLSAALAVALAACSDAGHSPVSPSETRPHPITLVGNSTQQLTWGDTYLSVPNQVAYSVQMPSGGQIALTFDARISYGSTAGNSAVLEVLVNGIPVTGGLAKGPTYTYPKRGGTENYYRTTPSGSMWGLFWSPDFTQNNVSTNYYYVQGGNAYGYTFDISGVVSYGQTNTITLRNNGGWVASASGNSPTVVLRNISVSASYPPL